MKLIIKKKRRVYRSEQDRIDSCPYPPIILDRKKCKYCLGEAGNDCHLCGGLGVVRGYEKT